MTVGLMYVDKMIVYKMTVDTIAVYKMTIGKLPRCQINIIENVLNTTKLIQIFLWSV
jgi:hypothetical protein